MDTTSTRGRGLRAWAVLAAILCIAGGMLAALPSPAAAADITIYVDTRAIDARTDLTATEKDEVKAAIKEEIKRNLETAFGPGKVEVTDKPSDKKKANRTVTIKNDLGTGTDKDSFVAHFILQVLDGVGGANQNVGFKSNAHLSKCFYFVADDFFWQTKLRNAIAQYTTKVMKCLINGNRVACACQIARAT